MIPTFVSLLLFFFTQVPGGQQATVKPAEKCTVEGSVVAATTGGPLKKAWLTLRKADKPTSEPYGASTDASGRFTLNEIEPGRYRLWVQRNGYVSQEYGQRAPTRPGTILTLQPGQQVKDVLFRLIPAAVITGHVYDEDGEPVAGASMQVLRYRYMEGRRQLLPAGMGGTNDQGEYRLYGFAPGRYYLSAIYTPGRYWGGGAFPTTEAVDPRASAGEGYAPVYYPGTTDPSQAASIELRSGDELRAVDLTLSPVRTVRVRGRVFNAVAGKPGRGATLFLQARESGHPRTYHGYADPRGGCAGHIRNSWRDAWLLLSARVLV